VAGSSENKANVAQLGLELGLSLEKEITIHLTYTAYLSPKNDKIFQNIRECSLAQPRTKKQQ
jgi:hypothetical protein